eukprot:3408240-Pyramimonas_sp.AAC.1
MCIRDSHSWVENQRESTTPRGAPTRYGAHVSSVDDFRQAQQAGGCAGQRSTWRASQQPGTCRA